MRTHGGAKKESLKHKIPQPEARPKKTPPAYMNANHEASVQIFIRPILQPSLAFVPRSSKTHHNGDKMAKKVWGAGVDVEEHGSVVVIAHDRPEVRNAMNIESGNNVAEAIDHYLADDGIRVLILTGRGGHFCSGGDISSMKSGTGISAEAGRKRMRKSIYRAERLYTSDKPVIAAVEGCAYGGGFATALLADIVIASQTARFCMSFSRIGLVPDTCSLYTLPRIVGIQRAKELMMTGREIDAAAALEYGIALEVVPEGKALERALEMARVLANASAVATALAKTGLNASLSSDFRTMVEYECTAQGVAYSSDYHREAVDRFLRKQEPKFSWKNVGALPKP